MRVPQLLLATLEELGKDDFKTFKWFLSLDLGLKEFKPIPKSHLESLDRHDTVDKMVERYCEDGAVTITIEILGRMNQNSAAAKLKKTYTEQRAAEQNASPSSALTPPTVSILTQDGSTMIVPQISGIICEQLNVNITM